MMFGDSPSRGSATFAAISQAFQVVDIAHPLRTFVSPDTTTLDATIAINEGRAEDEENEFAIVLDGTRIYGYIASDFIFDEEDKPHDGPADGPAEAYCTPIKPTQVVAGNTPLLDLISLFQEHYFFFVLTRNTLSHVVSFSRVDKLPFQLSLFALVIGVEAELIRLFSGSQARLSLGLLPEARLAKAHELFAIKHRNKRDAHDWPDQVLLCTTFIDKVTVLLRSPPLLARLPFESKGSAERFFGLVHDVRNHIAHSDSILRVLPNPAALQNFVFTLKQVIESLTAMPSMPQ